MIQLLGENEVLKTIILLAMSDGAGEISSERNLKLRLNKLYMNLNPKVIGENFKSNELIFVRDKKLLQENIKVFNMETDLNDIENVVESFCGSYENLDEIYELYKKMLCRANMTIPGFEEVFKLAMASLFYANSQAAGGGSTSAAIGVLWCDHRSSWSENDFVEFFMHELTHTLLFLDERRFVHYENLELVEKVENYALSAILNKKRPLDKVVHSIVVATEIVLLRENILGHPVGPKLHPPTEVIIKQTLKAIIDAKRKTNVLKDRSLQLLDMCEAKLISINSEVCHA